MVASKNNSLNRIKKNIYGLVFLAFILPLMWYWSQNMDASQDDNQYCNQYYLKNINDYFIAGNSIVDIFYSPSLNSCILGYSTNDWWSYWFSNILHGSEVPTNSSWLDEYTYSDYKTTVNKLKEVQKKSNIPQPYNPEQGYFSNWEYCNELYWNDTGFNVTNRMGNGSKVVDIFYSVWEKWCVIGAMGTDEGTDEEGNSEVVSFYKFLGFPNYEVEEGDLEAWNFAQYNEAKGMLETTNYTYDQIHGIIVSRGW